MNDDFFEPFHKPPRPEFEAALYKRISQPMKTQTRFPVLRPIVVGVSILAILIVAVLAIPSARSFAQAVLQQIGGYGFIVGTPEPYDASKVPGPITIVQSEQGVSIEFTGSNVTQVSGPTEASSLAGFTALSPSYLPAGFGPISDGWLVTPQGMGTVIMNGYHDEGKHFLLISQWKAGEGDLKTFTKEAIVDVTVRGYPGVWLPDSAVPVGKNALVWEENGITYSLISSSLPLDEMLKVAESLGG